MKLLFVADPLETFNIHKDSTYAMMLEGRRRGHEMWTLVGEDLAWRDGRVLGKCRPLSLVLPLADGTGKGWFRHAEAVWRDLVEFDAVLMRKDPPFDQAYLYATWLLEMAERRGARVFNRPQALRDFNEKLAIARFPEFIAPTLVTGEPGLIRDFLREQGDSGFGRL